MTSLRTFVGIAVIFTVVRGPGNAVRAQAPAEPEVIADAVTEPSGYRDAINQAVREFELQNFEESRALFSRAHVIYPNARTLRGLGIVEFELRNYGECIKQLEAALRSPVRPLEGKLRSDTEQLLSRAQGFIARVIVDSRPWASRVIVDGVPTEVPQGQAILLRVGEHTLEVQAPGYAPEKRQLSLKGGEEQRLTIVLTKPMQGPPLDENEHGKRWYRSPWLWTAVGAVMAGAAAGTAVALNRGEKAAEPYGGSSDTYLKGP